MESARRRPTGRAKRQYEKRSSSERDYNNIIILLNTSIHTGVQLRSGDAAAANRAVDDVNGATIFIIERSTSFVCVSSYIQLQYQSFI